MYRFISGTQAGLRGKLSLCRSRKAYRGRIGKPPRTVDSEGGHIYCAVALASGREDACSPGSSLYGSRTPAVCAVITQFVVRTHSFCRKYAKLFVVLTPHCAKQKSSPSWPTACYCFQRPGTCVNRPSVVCQTAGLVLTHRVLCVRLQDLC